MSKIYYGDVFDTADLTSTSMTIRMRPNKDIVLKAIRTWVILNNYTGNFTNLVCKIYSDRDGSVGTLLATSTNHFDKNDISTFPSGVREIYFDFSPRALQKNTFYHFVLNATGYVKSDSENMAWRKAWPNPVYPTGIDLSIEALLTAPYFLTVIGADF